MYIYKKINPKMSIKVKKILIIIFFISILTESIVFMSRMLPAVTVSQESLPDKFGDMPDFQASRKERLLLEGNYRYFKSNLENIKTAFDTDAIQYFDFSVSSVNLRRLTDSIMDNEMPVKEIYSKPAYYFVEDFIESYSALNNEEKRITLNVADIVIEQLLFTYINEKKIPISQINIYSETAGLINLKKILLQGYEALYRDIPWTGYHEFLDLWKKVIFVSDIDRLADKQLLKLFYFVNKIKCADFLLFVRSSNTYDNVNSFVRFKGYSKLIKIYETPGYGLAVQNRRAKIKSDAALTGDYIRFYSKPVYINIDSYFSDLNHGKLNPDVLYLHDLFNLEKDVLAGNNKFSYNVVKYTPNILEVTYNSNIHGFLYWSDNYDNHWEAFVDRNKTKIYKANGVFKAIEIPAGSHIVKFKYNPRFYKISMLLYYIVFIFCACFLIYHRHEM
ncbi:MAG: YfhO family protein [Candidatus Omnitrophica bacterium]|nr:YfhO family protein [Candidatus Omnitrophota bacterium]